MNPQLKALQDRLQALVEEAKTLSASTMDEAGIARAAALTDEIGDTKAQIKAITSLNGAAAASEEFLNGPTGRTLRSLASDATPTDLASVEPDKLMAATRKLIARGATPFLSSVLADRGDAREIAMGLGHFVLGFALHKPHQTSRAWLADQGFKAAQSEGTNEDGGYLVPEEYERALIVLREVFGVFRQYANVVPMAGDLKRQPRRTGGATAYFVGENQTIADSQAGWDMVELVARKLGAIVLSSSELDEDAIVSMGDTLAGEIAYAFAKKEDECGFNGDGTSTYGTITGVRQRLIDKWTTGGGAGLILAAGNAYSEVTLANFHSVQGALPVYAERNAKWYCHKVFWSTVLMKLALAAGGVPAAEIMMGGTKRFLGDEVVVSQVMPSTEANSQVPIVYGSLDMAAMLGNRRGVTLMESLHHKFAEDQLAIRGTERFAINVHAVETPGTDEAGPVVGLILAAA